MRRTTITYFLIIASFSLASCEKDIEKSRELDEAKLKQLYAEIKMLALSSTCTTTTQLGYKPLGSKACGGPFEFVVYSSSIDTAKLINQIKSYTQLQAEYNVKYSAVSDCSIPSQPKSITCQNGKTYSCILKSRYNSFSKNICPNLTIHI